MKRPIVLLSLLAVLALGAVATAGADALGPITFEPTAYAVGNINGQNGWVKTGAYDAAVVADASFPTAAGYGFGTQSLRISSSVTSGSFGDQTFAPPLASAAGESTSNNHFEASFSIGTALATQQPGLALSVSPDNGAGGRMSYLRFEDQADGVHVFFDDVTDNGPVGTTATFNEHDIATLSRTQAHTVRFAIDFKPGAGNDVVKVWIDSVLKATGTSWENYYRFDPEQTPTGNVVPQTRTVLFREGPWAAAPTTAGNGFLIDNVSMASSQVNQQTGGKDSCKRSGWKTFPGPSFRNQGQCIKAMINHGHHHGHFAAPKAPKNHAGDFGQGHDHGHHGNNGNDR